MLKVLIIIYKTVDVLLLHRYDVDVTGRMIARNIQAND